MANMSLSPERRAELRDLLRSDAYDGSMAYRAQLVLWHDEGMSAAAIARRAGTSRPTVYRWVSRYERDGVGGLVNQVSTGRPPEVSAEMRAYIEAYSQS